MAKITLTLCDVKPCNFPAEREFEVNGQKIYVCGESCFVKFWSREYAKWKTSPYSLKATANPGIAMASLDDTAALKDPNSALGRGANFQFLKPLQAILWKKDRQILLLLSARSGGAEMMAAPPRAVYEGSVDQDVLFDGNILTVARFFIALRGFRMNGFTMARQFISRVEVCLAIFAAIASGLFALLGMTLWILLHRSSVPKFQVTRF